MFTAHTRIAEEVLVPQLLVLSLLVFGSILIALTLGVLCAIYLSEYSRPGKSFTDL